MWYRTDGVMGIVGGDHVNLHVMVREGHISTVDVGGPAV